MKKSKIIIPLMSAVTATAAFTPIMSSCNHATVTPAIDEATKSQFDSVTWNCHLNQDSTIAFAPKKDQEIDPLSVSIKVGGTQLVETRDYKIYDNVITIFAAAMKSKDVKISLNAKYQHIIECLEPHWIVKPLMTNDSITASDIIVYLKYKDGTQETLDCDVDNGYEIYQVKKDGTKEKLEDFNTKPFVFTVPGQYYNFEIVYKKDSRVKLSVNNIIVYEPNENLFLSKYAQCYTNFKETEIAEKYGWVTFDEGAKYKGETDINSAALVYEYNGANAHFKDKDGNSTGYNCVFGGADIGQLKEWFDDYGDDEYDKEFTNTTTEFGFKITKKEDSDQYNQILFNKECYVTNWINTMDSTDPYEIWADTSIKNIKYTNYVKTSELKMDLSSSPLKSMVAYDVLEQTKTKKFIKDNEVDNEFILKFKTNNEIRKGKFVIYNKDKVVYQTEDMTITSADDQQIRIKITDWDNIDHDASLKVRFEAYETINLSLDSSLTDAGFSWNEGTSVTIDSSKSQWSTDLILESGKPSEAGTFYISYVDQVSSEEKILARTSFCQGSDESVNVLFKFDYLTTWYPIGKEKIQNTTLKFTKAREAALEVGTKIQQTLNPTITPSDKIAESAEESKVDISWATPLEKDTVFCLTKKDQYYPEDLVLTTVKAGAKSATLSFNDWDKITIGDTLIVNIKSESKLKVTCENHSYKLIEPQPGELQFVQMFLVPGYFKLSDPDKEYIQGGGTWSVKITNFTQTAGEPSGWKLFSNMHSCGWYDNDWLNVTLVGDGKITPHEFDKYSFSITLIYNGDNTHYEVTFDDMEIEVIWPYENK